jgi:hypothetical protein
MLVVALDIIKMGIIVNHVRVPAMVPTIGLEQHATKMRLVKLCAIVRKTTLEPTAINVPQDVFRIINGRINV